MDLPPPPLRRKHVKNFHYVLGGGGQPPKNNCLTFFAFEKYLKLFTNVWFKIFLYM